MNVAMILAGGVGNRMGAKIPKQYIQIKGKPIIAYTLEKFEKSKEIDFVEVVCATEWADYIKAISDEYGFKKIKWIVKGGATCQDSIRSGIFALREELSDEDILFLHMSVSPMISEDNIKTGIATCKAKGNAFAVQPCLFCMCKKTNEEWSDQNAYKEDYVQLNMPWIMHYGEIYDLYQEALKNGKGSKVNDYLPSLMFASGKRTYFYPDNDENRLKITTKGDLELFEAYLIMNEQKMAERS